MKCKDCYKSVCPDRCYTDDAECVLQQWTAKDFDWQSFRNQAAKDILCALINRENIIQWNGKIVNNHEDFVKMAIVDADELVKQLKEKEEK